MTTKYRINWRSVEVDATGHGEPVFETHARAQRVVDVTNAQIGTTTVYWVEAVEVAEEAPCNPAD